jgi:hypothetical protein
VPLTSLAVSGEFSSAAWVIPLGSCDMPLCVMPVRSGCGLPRFWRRQFSNSLWNCCSRSRH